MPVTPADPDRAIDPPTASLLVRPEADETGIARDGSVEIAWRRYGDGPQTILFIPTWNFVDSRVLRYQVEGLRDRYRVLTYDARGSGDSGRPPAGYTFDDHAADALAVLDATRTARASVVAASRGTVAALFLATSHAERVLRLVLVAPPPMAPISEGDADTDDLDIDLPSATRPDWQTDYERFVPWFIHAAFPEPGCESIIADIIAIGLHADQAMLVQQAAEADWDEATRRLGAVRCPTLVLHGTADQTLRSASVAAVAAAIPGARLELFDGLGHRPDISRPAIVNPMIAGFIDGGSP